MKSKLAQIISKFDYRQIKVAYFVLMLAVSILMRAPSDGGGGSI